MKPSRWDHLRHSLQIVHYIIHSWRSCTGVKICSSNKEKVLVNFSPKESLTFTTEPIAVKLILSFLQDHLWYILTVSSHKYRSPQKVLFYLAIYFCYLMFLQPNKVAALEIRIWQETLNKQTHKLQREYEEEDWILA